MALPFLGIGMHVVSLYNVLVRLLQLTALPAVAMNLQPLADFLGCFSSRYFCASPSCSPLGDSDSEESPAVQEMQGTPARSLDQEDPREEGMVTHFSILAWRIPWTGKLGRLRSLRLQRVGHDQATNTPFRRLRYHTHCQHLPF